MNSTFLFQEWQLINKYPNKEIYHHRYSEDLCETHLLANLTKTHIDQYTSRETYSYPFCPKIYKISYGKPNYENNQVLFDIQVIAEHIPLRMGDSLFKIEKEKIFDIIRAFMYIARRYGPFRPSERMIGCTNQGVVKIWLNQDYTCNIASEKLQTQKQMTLAVISLLRKYGIIDNVKAEYITNLRDLLESLKKKNKVCKTVYFEKLDNIEKQLFQPFLRERKTFDNFQNHRKEKMPPRFFTLYPNENENNDSTLSSLRISSKCNTTFVLDNAKPYVNETKIGLDFTRKTIAKKAVLMRHKSEDKMKDKLKSYKAIDFCKAKQQIPTHNSFVRRTKKCFTNFNQNRRSENEMPFNLNSRFSSKQRQPTFNQKDLKKNIKMVEVRPENTSKSKMIQPQSKLSTSIQPKISYQKEQKSNNLKLNKKIKSIQQTVKQEIDALFASNCVQLKKVDKEKLQQELNAVFELL